MNRSFLLWIAVVAVGCVPAAKAASTFSISTFTTASGATDTTGNPVDAEADFTFAGTNNTITLTLKNLEVNPTTVAQNITDFSFQLLNASHQVVTISATSGYVSSGQDVTINNNVGVLGATGDTGWALTNPSSNSIYLNVLGTATGPAHSIIGPGAGGAGSLDYSAAGGSITGNGPHNPFLYEQATFTFTITGLLQGTYTPTNVVFSFNTTTGDNVPGIPGVPEPLTLGLTGSGLAALYFFRKRRA